MKKVLLVILGALFFVSCTTMQEFKQSDVKEDGIRFKYGSDKGVKTGDTVVAYKKRWKGNSKGGYVQHSPIGTLTVIKVEPEYSMMKKNGEFEIPEGTGLQRE